VAARSRTGAVTICEERGSGIDKVVSETEAHQLPPPLWEQQEAAFRVTLFAPKPFREMDRLERVHATYLHACLRYEQRETATNASLRERFGVEPLLAFPSGALVHFAVSNSEVHMTTKLTGSTTRFLPFNKGDGGLRRDGMRVEREARGRPSWRFPHEHAGSRSAARCERRV